MRKLLPLTFALAAVACAGEFLPLETGNFWVYAGRVREMLLPLDVAPEHEVELAAA